MNISLLTSNKLTVLGPGFPFLGVVYAPYLVDKYISHLYIVALDFTGLLRRLKLVARSGN